MGYLDKWEKSVAARKGFDKTAKNKMLLSDTTRTGLKFTGDYCYNKFNVCVCACVIVLISIQLRPSLRW